jgi:hypothetical protein
MFAVPRILKCFELGVALLLDMLNWVLLWAAFSIVDFRWKFTTGE